MEDPSCGSGTAAHDLRGGGWGLGFWPRGVALGSLLLVVLFLKRDVLKWNWCDGIEDFGG